MKKVIPAVLVLAAAAAAGWLAFSRFDRTVPSGTEASSAASSAVSSAAPASSGSSAAEAVSSAAQTVSSASSPVIPKADAIALIQKAVAANWSKYSIKPASQTEQKTIGGKSYQTYVMWDEDYEVGPLLLVDPDSGKVYTWTETDSEPVPASEDPAFGKTIHTFTGTVVDGAMMSVLVKTQDGRQLSVRRLGIDTSGLKSLVIGDKIRVSYTGVIKGNDMSRAFITKLESVK